MGIVLLGGVTGQTVSRIDGSYNTGEIIANSRWDLSCAGGIAGRADGNMEIIGCYSSGKVSLQGNCGSSHGGIVGLCVAGTTRGCYYLKGSAMESIGQMPEPEDVEDRGEEVTEEVMREESLVVRLNRSLEESMREGRMFKYIMGRAPALWWEEIPVYCDLEDGKHC